MSSVPYNMAAKREGPLKIHLVHGAKNHFLTLAPDDCSDAIGVEHLAAAAEQATSIPRDKQKLIYKGKSLTSLGDKSKGLRALGLRDGAKVMLLGSKPSPASAPQDTKQEMGNTTNKEGTSIRRDDISKLETFESSLMKESSNLKTLIQELDDLKKDNNGAEAQEKELTQVRKRLMTSAEVLMRLLESLDSLRFDSDDSTSRGRRKTMVNQIQDLMDQCEALTSSLQDRLSGKN